MERDKNVLVTGGAGFIGSHLVDRLVQEGYTVSVVDDLSTGKKHQLNRSARFYKMDIRSPRIERVFRTERPAILVHFAAQMDVRRSTMDPIFDAQVNIVGTLNVLNHAVRYGARKVLFASSGGAVYGEQEVFPAAESHPTRPMSPYGISKLTGDHYLAYYQHATGLNYVSLRFGNVFGPRQDPEGEAGVVAIFTQKMLRGDQPQINGNGRQTRDFVYVDDVIDASVAVMAPEIRGIYNVGTSVETPINEIFNILRDITQSTCKEIHGPAKPGEQTRSVLDAGNLYRDFLWEPRVSLHEGLRRTVDYFRNSLSKR